MMNMPTFLATVDAIADVLDAVELRSVIHELAHRAPEEERDAIVRLLRSHAGTIQDLSSAGADEDADLLSRLDEVLEALVEIDAGECAITRITNEEWDDWYDDEEDEFEIEDDAGIADVVQNALDLVHECLDEERYLWGYVLGRFVTHLSVMVEDYVMGDETFGINELFLYDLVDGRIEDFVAEVAAHALWSIEGDERATAIWQLLQDTCCHTIVINDMISKGPDTPPDFDGFRDAWIALLGPRQDYDVERLLEDAVSYLEGPDEVFEAACGFAATHPEVFVKVLSSQADAGENMWVEARGQKALDLIPQKCVIRATTALVTADAASRLGHVDVAESCWLEAFRSNPTAVNYLRIRMGVRDWEAIADAVRAIYEERSLTLAAKSEILFFDGKLDEAFTQGLSEKGYLGWRGTFMKKGIALFLLLLYKGALTSLPHGLKETLYFSIGAFTVRAYRAGTGQEITGEDEKAFLELFESWRATVSVGDDDVQRWLQVIDQKLVGRVDAIMQHDRRNYYRECAAFVAALGEVRESRGETGEKARTLLAMRDRYPRRRNFVQDLQSFGMPDWRRR